MIDLMLAAGIMLATPLPCDDPAAVVGDCIAVQLPDETLGRQIDCPDGSVGQMMIEDMIICPEVPVETVEPTPPATPPAPMAVPPPAPPRVVVATPAPVVPTVRIDLWTTARQFLAVLLPWLF